MVGQGEPRYEAGDRLRVDCGLSSAFDGVMEIGNINLKWMMEHLCGNLKMS